MNGFVFFFQAEDGIRYLVRSRGVGDVYKRQTIPGVIGGRYGNTSEYQNVGNPVLDLNNNDNKAVRDRLQSSGYLEIKPYKGLSFRSMVGTDILNINERRYGYQFFNDEITFLKAGGNQRSERSSLNQKHANSFRWVWENIVTYEKAFGKQNKKM